MVMTQKLARGIGLDAGYKNMRRHGRITWNKDDFDAATAAYRRAYRLIPWPDCATDEEYAIDAEHTARVNDTKEGFGDA